MEDEARAKGGKTKKAPVRFPPLLEWWHENFMLIRDIVTRRYRVHVQSYGGLLADPDAVVRQTIEWLGHGDADAAVGAVKPQNRTQKAAAKENPEALQIEPEYEDVFELLYRTVDERQALTAELIGKFNGVNAKLLPRIREAQRAVALDAQRRRAAGQARSDDPGPDDIPSW
jgi:hypothetical protein